MIAKFLANVKGREGPSTLTESVELYSSGQKVIYDKTVNNEGRLWITHVAKSGNRRYCCAIDLDGEQYIDLGVDDDEEDDNSIGNF